MGFVVTSSVVLGGIHQRVALPVRRLPRTVAFPVASVHWRTHAASVSLAVAHGPVLFQKNPGTERPIASVTKMMTANLVLTHPNIYPLNRVITITAAEVKNDRHGLVTGDSEVPLRLGQQVTVKDLLYALMLPSADDGAWTLADNYPGGASAFIKAMNQRARVLGMDHTHYVDPDGVNRESYSTTHDLLRLIRHDMALGEFRRLVETRIQKTRFGRLTNLNQLLWSYAGATGIKTGWTPSAGSCLAFSATRSVDRHRVSLEGVVLDEPNFNPMFNDVAQLLDTGFSALRYHTVVQKGAVAAVVSVKGGWFSPHRTVPLVVAGPIGAFATSRHAVLVVRWTKHNPSRYQAGETVGYAGLQEAGWKTLWVPIKAAATIREPWYRRV